LEIKFKELREEKALISKSIKALREELDLN